jgi:hypothetical protein
LYVQVRNGQLFVNGVAQEEPFISERPSYVLNKMKVPPGEVSMPLTHVDLVLTRQATKVVLTMLPNLFCAAGFCDGRQQE